MHIGGVSRHAASWPGARRAKGAATGALLAGFAACGALAADVYVSLSPDGTARYASQPLDASYTLLSRETPGSSTRPSIRVARRKAPQDLASVIERVAQRHALPPSLIEAIVAVESGFDPRAVSPKGARGAMQLMPATGRRYGLTAPQQFESAEHNIDAGARHLKDLLASHGGSVPLALAAYNAGSGAVRRHGHRIPPYSETMLYVPAVLSRTVAAEPPPKP